MICFPEMRPQVASYNKDTDAWSFGQFTFQTHNSQLMCPFVRIGVPGASMSASGVTGSITLTCSQNYFTNAMTGRVLSILGRQVVLDTYSSATSMTANVTYQLSDRVQFGAVEKTTTFRAGMIAETMISKVKVEVGNINAGSNYVEGTMMSALEFSLSDAGIQRYAGFGGRLQQNDRRDRRRTARRNLSSNGQRNSCRPNAAGRRSVFSRTTGSGSAIFRNSRTPFFCPPLGLTPRFGSIRARLHTIRRPGPRHRRPSSNTRQRTRA